MKLKKFFTLTKELMEILLNKKLSGLLQPPNGC